MVFGGISSLTRGCQGTKMMQVLAPKSLAGRLCPLHVQCSEIFVAPILFCSDLVLGAGVGGIMALSVSDAVLMPSLFQSIYVGGDN